MEHQIEQPISTQPGQILVLGHQGENMARRVIFDLSDLRERYPQGRFALAAQRNGDAFPYPAARTTLDGNCLIWTPTDADTAVAGYGRCELRCYDGETLTKSEVWQTFTLPALAEYGEAPEAWQDYIAQVQRIGTQVQAAQSHTPRIGENGNWQIWSIDAEQYVDTGLPSRGERGERGGRGEQGDPGQVPESALIHRTLVSEDGVLSIPDGADGVPVSSLRLTITAQQSGSGDPLPTNVRLITGKTTVGVAHQQSGTTTIRLTDGEDPLTVYGGTLDAATGLLTVTHQLVERTEHDGMSYSGSTTDRPFLKFSVRTESFPMTDSLCSKAATYVGVINSARITEFCNSHGGYGFARYNGSQLRVYMPLGSAETEAAALVSAGNPIQFCVRLETPLTYQLTPAEIATVLGQNDFQGVSGTLTALTYCADASLADGANAKKVMLTSVETAFTATRNYTVGELLIVGDTLYKVTENIAGGSAITPGVNVSETTVAAEIALAAASGGGGSGGGSVTVDSALSASSTNPVQNKTIKAALDGKANATSVPASANVDANGLISFKNADNSQLFTVQLPLYAGGIS